MQPLDLVRPDGVHLRRDEPVDVPRAGRVGQRPPVEAVPLARLGAPEVDEGDAIDDLPRLVRFNDGVGKQPVVQVGLGRVALW